MKNISESCSYIDRVLQEWESTVPIVSSTKNQTTANEHLQDSVRKRTASAEALKNYIEHLQSDQL